MQSGDFGVLLPGHRERQSFIQERLTERASSVVAGGEADLQAVAQRHQLI